MTALLSERESTTVQYGGYAFLPEKLIKHGTTIRMKCEHRNRGCRAWIHVNAGTKEVLKFRGPHEHNTINAGIEEPRLWNAIKSEPSKMHPDTEAQLVTHFMNAISSFNERVVSLESSLNERVASLENGLQREIESLRQQNKQLRHDLSQFQIAVNDFTSNAFPRALEVQHQVIREVAAKPSPTFPTTSNVIQSLAQLSSQMASSSAPAINAENLPELVTQSRTPMNNNKPPVRSFSISSTSTALAPPPPPPATTSTQPTNDANKANNGGGVQTIFGSSPGFHPTNTAHTIPSLFSSSNFFNSGLRGSSGVGGGMQQQQQPSETADLASQRTFSETNGLNSQRKPSEIIDLTAEGQSNDEGDEEILFSCRCKLYELSPGLGGNTKERGTGKMTVLKSRLNGNLRCVMYSENANTPCANFPIPTGGLQIGASKKVNNILTWECHDRSNPEAPDGETLKMLGRFKDADTANNFMLAIKSA